jgi:hypothetical protein
VPVSGAAIVPVPPAGERSVPKIGIATFARDSRRPDAGSTRIRVTWPMRYWPEAEELQPGGRYDVIIFQKAYWVEYARRFTGLKILDLCDPDFLLDAPRCQAMMDACDVITCSSVTLVSHVAGMTHTPVRLIPDRIDFHAVGSHRKEHRGPTRTAAWYGYSMNYPLLDLAIDGLLRAGVPNLLVIGNANEPYVLPPAAAGRLALVNRAWSEETIYRDLLNADVVLNPRSEEVPWRFKSGNKTLLAWALGLPVAHDRGELESLMTEHARRCEADRRYDEVRASHDVRRTVDDYRAVIAELSEQTTHACRRG